MKQRMNYVWCKLTVQNFEFLNNTKEVYETQIFMGVFRCSIFFGVILFLPHNRLQEKSETKDFANETRERFFTKIYEVYS